MRGKGAAEMKGEKRLWAAILSGAVLLSGCSAADPAVPTPSPTPSASPVVEREMGFALPCCPEAGFHPVTGSNRLNLALAPLIYQGLFQVDGDFQAQKDLCESYTVSEDGLRWTFQLAGAVFSDGSSLTAREAVDSLNAARLSPRYEGRLRDVKTVAAEGETVVVALSRPNGGLPLLLDVPIFKEGEDPQRPLGTGPYALAEDEGGLALKARQGRQMPLERIALRTVEAGDDLVYAFDAKEISLVDGDLTGTTALGYSGRMETVDYPTTTLLYLGCNGSRGPCREQEVRQALALALDREEIVERLLSGHAVASPLPVHPRAPGYDRDLAKQWSRDEERAGALLEEGGWQVGPEGTRVKGRQELVLRLVVNQDNTFKTAVAERVASSLRELGVSVTLDKLSWEDFMTALERGEFDLFLGESAMTPDFDLEPFLGEKGELNYMGFRQNEVWELMEQYRASQGEQRVTTLVNLCGRTAELAPFLPICFKNGSLLIQWGQLSGVRPTQRNLFAGMEEWVVRRS